MADNMIVEATPNKVSFMNRGSNYEAKQAKLKKDEEEIEELLKAQSEDSQEETEEQEESQTENNEVEAKEDDEDDSNLSREEKSFKKRYGDLRRHMATKEKEWKAEVEKAKDSSTANFRTPKTDEDIEAWAKEYPDVASIVETIADRKASERFKQAEDRFKELDDAKYEASRTKAETEIRKSHSDFDELREADDFHDWVEEQPKWVRDALYENSDDAKSVIRVLDLYKVDNGLTPSARKSKAKDAAKTVTKLTRTKVDANDASSMIRESDVQKMSDSEFEEKYEAIQAAMQSNKFVYDVSGRAR